MEINSLFIYFEPIIINGYAIRHLTKVLVAIHYPETIWKCPYPSCEVNVILELTSLSPTKKLNIQQLVETLRRAQIYVLTAKWQRRDSLPHPL